jgi:MFS transporter, MHS family, alpha-ketoglutarate permease
MSSTGTPKDTRNRRTLLGVGVGHALEWYDFGIYATFVTYFSGQFFDDTDPVSAVLSSLAVFAVGFLARPVGGLVIGRYADRIGRRPMMALTVGGMAGASLVIGLSPTYASIGVGASAILLLARVVQGFAVGGELPSAQTYLAEAAPPERRGLWSSVMYVSSVAGNTVGVLLGLLLTLVLSDDAMSSWGWRVPFLVGGALGLVALWIRRSMAESDAFSQQEAAPAAARTSPWAEVLRHKKQALQVVGMTVGITVTYYTWVIAAPSYAISQGVDDTRALLVGVVASLVLIVALPLWGRLSDRVGRKPVLLTCCVGTAVLLFPLQPLLSHGALGMLAAMVPALIFVGAGIAVIPAAYAEMFPTRIRTVGLAVPYSFAVALFGGTAPYLQTWATDYLSHSVYTGYVVVLLLVSAATITTLRDNRTEDLVSLETAEIPVVREGATAHALQ